MYEHTKPWKVPFSTTPSDGPVGVAMKSCPDDRAAFPPGCKLAGQSSYVVRGIGCCRESKLMSGVETLARLFKGATEVNYDAPLQPTRSDKHICGGCSLVWCATPAMPLGRLGGRSPGPAAHRRPAQDAHGGGIPHAGSAGADAHRRPP